MRYVQPREDHRSRECPAPAVRIGRVSQLIAAGVLFAWAASAQTPENREWVESDPPLDTVEETTRIIEVQVPVNVTNRNGQPVRDLTVEDFQILDEGDAQEITGFEIIDLAMIEQTGDLIGGAAVSQFEIQCVIIIHKI